MRRNLKAEIGRFAQYELCYGNRMYQAEPAYNIISTGFTIEGVSQVVYLADQKISSSKGRIFFFTYVEGGEPTIVKKNAGTVDYLHGEILIDTVNILSTVIENNVIEIQAVPHSNDVIGLRDLYIKFDMTNTTLTMVPDTIASGENTSGSRFIHTHSYYMPKFTRDSKSEVSTTGLVTSVDTSATATTVTSSSTSAARTASSTTTSASSTTTATGGGSSSTPSSGSGY